MELKPIIDALIWVLSFAPVIVLLAVLWRRGRARERLKDARAGHDSPNRVAQLREVAREGFVVNPPDEEGGIEDENVRGETRRREVLR
jgi:hypothetical protein